VSARAGPLAGAGGLGCRGPMLAVGRWLRCLRGFRWFGMCFRRVWRWLPRFLGPLALCSGLR